jgi:DUF4097 and DUF4098 domain-containing protein YvlB
MIKTFILSLALALVSFGDDRVREEFRHTFTLVNGAIDVSSFNGSIEVVGGDTQTVEVTGSKHAANSEELRKVQVEVVQEGNVIRARGVRSNEKDWRCNCGVQFLVRVPRRTELGSLRTSNGAIRIENIEGRVDAKTSNGSVRLANIKGKVDARTSNGAVQLDSITGPVVASTSNGSIKGRITDTVTSDPVKMTTSNGAIEVRIEAQHNNDVTASTSNGGITVRMPDTANARISASTSNHESVTTDFPVVVRGTLSKNKIEGSVGNGNGPLLQLNTSNGSIRLLRL